MTDYVAKRARDEALMKGLLDKLQGQALGQNPKAIVEQVEAYIKELAALGEHDGLRQIAGVYPQARLMQALGLAGLQFYKEAIEVAAGETDRIAFSGPPYINQAPALLDLVLTLQVGTYAHSMGQLKGPILAVPDYERLIDRIAANMAKNQDMTLYRRALLNRAIAQRFGSSSGIDIVNLPLELIITETIKCRELLQTAIPEFNGIQGYEFPSVSVAYSPEQKPFATIDGISVRLEKPQAAAV